MWPTALPGKHKGDGMGGLTDNRQAATTDGGCSRMRGGPPMTEMICEMSRSVANGVGK